MRRALTLAALAGVSALAACVPALLRQPAPPAAQLWAAYLAACLYWLGLSLGSLSLLLVLALAGGSWGAAARPVLLAAPAALPLLLVLWLPLLGGLRALYPWLDPSQLGQDATLRAQTWYLDERGLLLRAALCFALWLWLAPRLRAPHPGTALASVGALSMLLGSSVFAVDWAMSLQPEFHSASFGLTVAVSQMLGAAALVLLLRPPQGRALEDFGKVLLMLSLGWAYLEFMSYLTAWSADLPGETAWYLPRTQGPWRWLGAAMLALQFLLPFALLLGGAHRRGGTRWIAGAILLGNACEWLWRVCPVLHGAPAMAGACDGLAVAGVGSLWLAVVLRRLRRETADG